jgi:VIT1/CCC1 family predicted Fe2+/Mn2+ transporter
MDMNIALWVIQIILAIKMLNVSYSHGLRRSQPTMQEAMQRMGKFSNPLHDATSACTFLGVIGLILPGVFASPIWIIPVTALLLSILLLASIFFHVRSRKQPKIFVSVILFTFAAFVAYGRWMLVPLLKE